MENGREWNADFDDFDDFHDFVFECLYHQISDLYYIKINLDNHENLRSISRFQFVFCTILKHTK
jgi:hypothetical protein